MKLRPVNPNQLALAFPGESPAERKAANNRAIEESIRQHYPMTDEERSWLPQGVRLARFVPLAECEYCNFGPEDHTLGWRFPGKICLKDVHRKEKE